MFNFYDMSTCDNCGKFVCDSCSVVVSNNRDKYPEDKFNMDFCVMNVWRK